jgi:catechol 2,3-dioxygenase-like lactoylglutathione lyase family enzyme
MPEMETALDSLHHVAVAVRDISQAVEWYTRTFACKVQYQDATWAMLEFANIRLALVVSEQHPPHVAFTSPEAEKFGELKPHRDGTRSCYVLDPSGNAVEILAQD